MEMPGESVKIGRDSYEIFSLDLSEEDEATRITIKVHPRLTCAITTLQRWAEKRGGSLVQSGYEFEYSVITVVYPRA